MVAILKFLNRILHFYDATLFYTRSQNFLLYFLNQKLFSKYEYKHSPLSSSYEKSYRSIKTLRTNKSYNNYCVYIKSAK